MSRWDDQLPEDLRRRPDIVAARRQLQLQEIDRTIRLADVRCIPFESLLNRIEKLWKDEAASEIVFRVCEEPLSHNQLHALAQSVKFLADAVDCLPSASKTTIDRAVRRMVARMPPEIAAPIAEPWLEHKRKFRREIAYRILRESGVPAAYGPRLLAVFQRNGDQECLKLLARNPSALVAAGGVAIAKLADEEYWRMRIIQSLLIADIDGGMSASAAYPREFVWAAGRQKDPALLPAMRSLFDTSADDLSFVSLYAWALGQIGARDELYRVRELVRREAINDV
jgi:hypothetical protein